MAIDLTGFLADLIKIDTTNPPGNETPAAEYVKAILDQEGIETQVLESAPGRGNAVARLRGDGSKKPVLLLSHLDVVNAQPEQWTHHPFSGLVKDGVIWGRGALDCKNLTALEMGVMIMLKKRGVSLKRDVILAATADEESGGRMGLGYLTDKHLPLVDSEFCINEGGGMGLSFGSNLFYGCNTGEKGATRLRLIGKGRPGHASVPREDTSVARLCEAVLILTRSRLPVHMTDTVAKFLAGLFAVASPGKRFDPRVLEDEATADRLLGSFLEDKYQRDTLHAMLRNTATPTILKAGYRINVIPEEATAEIDGRILPGQTPEGFVQEVTNLVGHLVDIVPTSGGTGSESPVDTEMFRVIEDVMRSQAPGAHTVPILVTGCTDARYLRPRGITTYGFTPTPPGEAITSVHGIDERCTLAGLEFGLKALYDVIERLCS